MLVRAHYAAPLARLGPYPIDALDMLAYDRRELFEYWGPRRLPDAHRAVSAAAIPNADRRGARAPAHDAAHRRRADEPRPGPWWGWGAGKAALECLYDAGLVAIAGRRGFQRLYDLAERVIPATAPALRLLA